MLKTGRTGRHRFAACLLALCFLGQAARPDNEPTGIIRAHTTKIVDMIRKEGAGSRAKVIDEASPLFAWRAIAEDALGEHWKDFRSAQRNAFVEAFRTFLIAVFIDDIVSLTSQTVDVLPPTADNDFVVRTTVTRRQGDVFPIHYKMMQNPAGPNATPKWQIYDVLRRQESVVLFYRRQFEHMLKSRSPDDVIKELQNKRR